ALFSRHAGESARSASPYGHDLPRQRTLIPTLMSGFSRCAVGWESVAERGAGDGVVACHSVVVAVVGQGRHLCCAAGLLCFRETGEHGTAGAEPAARGGMH